MLSTVKHVRGCRKADVEVSMIALLAGRNGAGKSSFLEATAAALTGDPMPLGLPKKDARLLVTDGAETGSVSVRYPDRGVTHVDWPKGEVIGDGRPPFASPIACGLDTLLGLDTKALSAILTPLLGADPTRDDLAEALTKAGADPHLSYGESTLLTVVWDSIEHFGWEQSHKQASENMTRNKGRWEQVTKARYGSRKAETWRPEGWQPDLDTADEAALQRAIDAARNECDRRIGNAAKNSALLQQGRRRLEELSETASKLEEGQTALAGAEAELQQALDTLDASPDPGGDSGLPCPHCGGMVRVMFGTGAIKGAYTLEPTTASVDRDEYDRQHKEREAARRNVNEARTRVDRVRRGLARVESAVEEAANLRDTIAQLEREATATSEEEKAAAETALTSAEARLARWQARREANTIARLVAREWATAAVLSTSGVRQQKLDRQLDDFNAVLRACAEAARWPVVEVSLDMQIRFGGRHQRLWSASERFRADAMLRLAVAQIDGSEVAILDAADVLDASNRNALFALLRFVASRNIRTLVAMTINEPRLVPDLAAAGLGRSYWIEGGVAQPIGPRATAEAAA